MAKQESGWCKRIEIWWLLKGVNIRCGTFISKDVSWERGGSISLYVSISDYEKYARFVYMQTDNSTGEKESFDYKVSIIETQCNFGGVRYWFECPLYKNNKHCGRRVGVLYKGGNYFGCRHCYDLTYSSRKLSGTERKAGRIISIPELDKARERAKRTHYRGKHTRKYLSYLKKQRHFRRSLMEGMDLLNKTSNKDVKKFNHAKKVGK